MIEIDRETGWEGIPQTDGFFSKLLSSDFDEARARGYRTRLVRVVAGGETFEPFTHAYWEEVYLLEGTLVSKLDATVHEAQAYVIRPPGTPHGPFVSHTGCLMLEMQYFADRSVDFKASS